jgi:hypothetical protein
MLCEWCIIPRKEAGGGYGLGNALKSIIKKQTLYDNRAIDCFATRL